ncbi:MAG: hypothetical protein JNJ54_15055 [Myxococcaceae bacterium]|nr:hypothetical protein [Myxococcaceae bacterium]
MRTLALALAVPALVACGPDDLTGLQRRGAGVTEVSHIVEVHFEEGGARLEVQRQFRNDDDVVQSLTRHLPLPDGVVATSLSLRRADVLVPARLSTQEQVADQWGFLTSPGEAQPDPIGKLEWSFSGGLDLELFGLPPRETVTVAYELHVAPRYEAGVLVFDLPREDGALPPRFDRATAEETVDGYVVRRQHQTQPIADVRWAVAQLDTDRTLWRLEVDAAPLLGTAPVAPNVVFVVDASHSEGPAGIAAQLELLAPYLANVPDARVELVLTRRFAERLFGRFVPAVDVPGLLAATPPERLAPGNGSNLDVGAALAAGALAEAGGAGRVVLFTDELLRDGFSAQAAIDALAKAPAGTVAHVVRRTGEVRGTLIERRDDDAPLADVAEATGGIFVRVAGAPADVARAARTLLGLVRPVRIDGLTVSGERLPDLGLDPQLDEGTMVRLHGVDAEPPEQVTLTGRIWAREFRRDVTLDRALLKRLPGLAVGFDDLRGQLSSDELRSAAFLAQAVSPETSLLAAPPTAAPSTAGLAEGTMRGLSMHGIGCSGCGTSSRCGIGVVRRAVDFEGLLRALLAPGVAACVARLGEPAASTLTLEATGDEVVEVEVTETSSSMGACLTEAAWALRLGSEFVSHRTYTVALRPER